MYLGVDGGGTKTAFALIDDGGNLLADCVRGTCFYLQVGFDGFEKVLRDGIQEVLSLSGRNLSDLNFAFLGLPGYGERLEDEPRILEVVCRTLENGRFRCANDAEAGWAGSLACQAGVNVVAGTGTIGFGRDYAGKSARAGGWGDFCGDEGSAYWLGKRALSLFSKQADNRLTRTPLYDLMRDRFNLRRDLDLLSLVYDGLKDSRKDIAQLAVILYKAAHLGDPYAIDAYREAAYETSLIVRAIIGQLNFDRQHPTLVSYSGGVFSAEKWVVEPLSSYLSDINIELIRPIFSPVIGAALYALIIDKELTDWTDVVGRLEQASA